MNNLIHIFGKIIHGTFNGNLCSFSPLITNFYNGHLILTLTDIEDTINCNQITGDLDENQIVNVVDIIILVDSIVNLNDLEICQNLSSDFDFNNILNVSDVVSLIQIILGN